MDCHTFLIDEGIVEEKLGVNIFLTLSGGGSHMLHKSGKGVIKYFPVIQNNFRPPWRLIMTGGVKPFNGIPNPLLISGSSTTIHL